jgi:hypothetical protein
MIRSIEPPFAANALWMLKQTVVGRRSVPNLDSRTCNGAKKRSPSQIGDGVMFPS